AQARGRVEGRGRAREGGALRAISVMYHDVVHAGRPDESGFAGADAALYKLTRGDFVRHLHALREASDAPPAVASELTDASGPTGTNAPEPRTNANASDSARAPWLLTFDDGGVSAHTIVADLLEEYGWRGHFFVTTGRVGTQGFLTRAQVRELHARGHVVGSHSHTHPQRMSLCNAEELRREWASSLEFLSDVLGEAVTVASVPGGYYSRRVAEAAARAGVRRLFSSEPTARCFEVEGCLVLGRYSVQRWTTPETVAGIVRGRLAPRLRQRAFWEAKKVTKKLGGEYYLKLRQALVGRG
ncbi:MAG TPA: polysaccharide deacetylase family protein, partial [Pyrinomonadaceae bacterium]|nr:polysaccharide deacetylase family protein [Pyrinomonadaceae bacterium]